MKQVIGAQGEVVIIKIASLPTDMISVPVERVTKGFIISHSESGNHHLLTGGDVMERLDVPAGMKILYAILNEPAQFIQDTEVPHASYDLESGIYEFRIAREVNPFNFAPASLVGD